METEKLHNQVGAPPPVPPSPAPGGTPPSLLDRPPAPPSPAPGGTPPSLLDRQAQGLLLQGYARAEPVPGGHVYRHPQRPAMALTQRGQVIELLPAGAAPLRLAPPPAQRPAIGYHPQPSSAAGAVPLRQAPPPAQRPAIGYHPLPSSSVTPMQPAQRPAIGYHPLPSSPNVTPMHPQQAVRALVRRQIPLA